VLLFHKYWRELFDVTAGLSLPTPVAQAVSCRAFDVCAVDF